MRTSAATNLHPTRLLYLVLPAVPQVRELNSIIDHMHTREDLYRKTIRVRQLLKWRRCSLASLAVDQWLC